MANRRDRPSKQRPPAPDALESDWRLFIAVPLPQPVIRLIGDVISDLSDNDWPVRWIAPETAHLTLEFIGETPSERAELLRLSLGPVIARHTAFDLRTAGLGVFPNPRRPRVIWLGLHGQTERLAALQRDADDLLRRLEFPFDERPFNPHITLGRVRDTRDHAGQDLPVAIERGLAAAATRHDLTGAPRPIPVREVLIVRSFLSRQGARHEPIGRYPLRPPETAATP